LYLVSTDKNIVRTNNHGFIIGLSMERNRHSLQLTHQENESKMEEQMNRIRISQHFFDRMQSYQKVNVKDGSTEKGHTTIRSL